MWYFAVVVLRTARFLWLRAILGSYAVLSSVTLTSSPALACSASPTPTYAVTQVWPQDGAMGVARNSGIVVTAVASSEPGGPGFPLAVKVQDVETGATIAGRQIEWHSDEELVAAWYLDEPLLPLRTYRLEASIAEFEDLPEGEPMVSTFTTSESLLEPLGLVGEFEISLEGYDAEVQSCDNTSCGPANCIPAGTRRALRARISLPAVQGGQAIDNGYRARLYFTDDTLPNVTEPDLDGFTPRDEDHDVGITHYFRVGANERTILEQEIFEEPFDYAPCFMFVVWDPAGNKVETGTCLPVMSPGEVRMLAAADELPSRSDGANRGSNNADPSFAGRSGCTLASSTTSPSHLLLALGSIFACFGRRYLRGAPHAKATAVTTPSNSCRTRHFGRQE